MSRYVLAVDPGKIQAGVAIFCGQTLVHATLARNPTDKPGSDGPEVWRNTARAVSHTYVQYITGEGFGIGVPIFPDRLVLEVPQIYRAGLQKGDQADIGALFGVDGAIASLYDCPVTWYHPAKWKQQVPKAVMCNRIMGRLTDDEKKAVDPSVPKGLLHNVVDAVGIGLFYLGRLK